MIIHQVFSKKQTMITLTIRELTKRVIDGRVLLREVSQPHVRSIKRYIFDNVQTGQVYFPSFVAHLEEGELVDGVDGVLSIIDGSHRIKALVQLEEMMHKALNSEKEDDLKKGYKIQYLFEHTLLSFQTFEGFTVEEKDQLYIDLNTKGKKVSLSKRIAYDSRSHINQITNYVLQLNENLQLSGVEMEKAAIIRPGNKKLLSLTQLRQIVSIFLTGKALHSTAEITVKHPLETHEYLHLINVWLDELFTLCPASIIGNYRESMLAGYPLLISVALYANDGLVFASFERREKILRERMAKLKQIDFSRKNDRWLQFNGSIKGREKLFQLANNKNNIAQLVKWLEQQRR
jgi:DNA sulfur modification protein DndB